MLAVGVIIDSLKFNVIVVVEFRTMKGSITKPMKEREREREGGGGGRERGRESGRERGRGR